MGLSLFLVLGVGVVAAAGKPGPRSNQEVAAEREHHRQEVEQEIRTIALEYHAQLPQDKAAMSGAAYARYSSRHQDSIADQIRGIFQDAAKKSVFIPLEHIFFDQATRGAKNDRAGLNGLRALLARKGVPIVFFFATNRLFRKVYRSLQFVEEQLVERNIRGVFVKSGVDTAEKQRWSQMLMFNAQMDEFQSKSNVEHIRAGHEGLLEKRQVHGTLCLGYRGEELPGEMTRRGKTRKRISIDPESARYVNLIFTWFVDDRLTLAEIARRLNADAAAPCPPKSTNRHWTPVIIKNLIRNHRYRGCWRYGESENTWISSRDYSRQVRRPLPLKEIQFEELRLVSDEKWHRAQSYLSRELARAVGRKPRGGAAVDRPRFLSSLFVCPTHQHTLYVGGGHGRYLFCPRCRNLPPDARPLFSHFPRKLALEKTCRTLTRLIRADDELVAGVIQAVTKHVAALQQQQPDDVGQLTTKLEKLDQRIGFILRNPGDSVADQAGSEAVLREARRNRLDLAAKLELSKSLLDKKVVVPSGAEVNQAITRMTKVLRDALRCDDAAGAGQAREILDLLTGGRIELYQHGSRVKGGGWLEGRFQLHVVTALAAWVAGVPIHAEAPIVVSILYRTDDVDQDRLARVMKLFDGGQTLQEIRRATSVSQAHLRKLLTAGLAQRGDQLPDFRKRRRTLAVDRKEPQYVRLADRVKELADQGLTFDAIGSRLTTNRRQIETAWRYWHASRGLTPMDGRARRKLLPRTTRARKPAADNGATN